MNKVNPKKLLNSKWTAVKPLEKEKHFLIIDVDYDEDQLVIECVMQALMSKRNFAIEWRDLKNTEQWLQGWK